MKLLCVIGNPIKHSLSPLIQNYAIKKLNLNAHYTKILLPQNIDAQFLRQFLLDSNLSGINITLPFKEIAFSCVDEVRGLGNEIKAINTIVKIENKLIGYNTDADGFKTCIENYIKNIQLGQNAKKIQNALIIGAGGSAKSSALALKNLNLDIHVINRSAERLEFFKSFCNVMTNLDGKQNFDIIINATSTSLQDTLPLNQNMLETIFKDSQIIFDLAYKPDESTIFCDLAKNVKEKYQLDLQYFDGKDMLVFQGALAFIYFFNLKNNYFNDIAKFMNEAIRNT